jgi:hypothetical protein
MPLYLSALDFLSYELCGICNIYGILQVNFVWLIWYTSGPCVDTIRRYIVYCVEIAQRYQSPLKNRDYILIVTD